VAAIRELYDITYAPDIVRPVEPRPLQLLSEIQRIGPTKAFLDRSPYLLGFVQRFATRTTFRQFGDHLVSINAGCGDELAKLSFAAVGPNRISVRGFFAPT